MEINKIGINPYIQKVNTVNKTNTELFTLPTNDSSKIYNDSFIHNYSNEESDIRKEFEDIKGQQGVIGKLWDGFKNLFGMKSGSNHIEKIVEQTEKGEITEEEAKQAVENYKEGQKTCVDVVADMASGILSVAAFALAVPTGGASLAIGLTAATLVGAGVKVGIKAGDAIATGKEYSGKDLLYDTATGGINGLLAPITNGLGNTVTKTIGKKLGLKIVQEGAEEVAEQAVKQTFKQAAKSAILNQTLDVAGGTIGKRALALGAGMAVDGALGGASDNMVRAALNGENVIQAGIEGAASGAVMSPIIGGGFRIAGKAGKALNNKITSKIVLPDGINTKFKQGSTGDCALLSTIDGMMNNPTTAKTFKKSITKTVAGDYNVQIGDHIVKVAKSSLSDEMLSDTTGIRIFEQAYKQLTGDIDGGFAEVVAKQFGLNPVHIVNDSISDELLDNLARNKGNTVLSLGTLVDTDGAISSTGSQRHYFTIKDIDADSKIVTLTSPIDTSKPIQLSYDDVKTMGISIDGGTTKSIDLPTAIRNVDEITFKVIPKTRSKEEINKISELLLQIDDIRKSFDESNITELIEELDNGTSQIISGPEYQRIKNSAFTTLFEDKTIDIGGRKIYLTEEQQKIYTSKLGQSLTGQNISKEYCAQVIMSDAMFIEATAINLGLDIKGKNTQEIFEEIGLLLADGKDVFPGVSIQNKTEIANEFFGRYNHTDAIRSVNNMGGDKAVHEINKALMETFEKDQTFQENWIKYCTESTKFKQLSALADTYKTQLRNILNKNNIPDKKIETFIKERIENEDHIIFRALQRDSIFDVDSYQIQKWGEIEGTSFIDVLAQKLLSNDTSEEFMNSQLTRYGNKFDTITYNFRNWRWETDGIYIPQYAS